MFHYIKSLLSRVCFIENEDFPIILEKPKNKDLGHLATTLAFSIAKARKTNPISLAKDIADKLSVCDEFERVEALNGFVNLTLSDKFLNDMAYQCLCIPSHATRVERILLEFVSANPTGPLHIGHARGAVYGDALARVGEFLGYKIYKEYYVNDAGAQIQNLGLSIFLAGREHILHLDVDYPEQYYKGEYIIDLAKECENHFGKDIFEHEDCIPLLAEYGKDIMLLEIKDNLAQVGIFFDTFVSEKSLYTHWRDTLDRLKAHGGIYNDGGKIWIASTQVKDDKDRVLVRENGEPTYLAGDVIYHQNKFSRDFTNYINIWGADHHGYIARVKAAIHFLGYDENKLEVLLSQMVSLLKAGEPYKMSKRAGNFILMKDVVDEIGADALRFIFLSKKPDTHLEFDVEELKKQDANNPIYYINYANARIHTLFEKADVNMQDFRTHKNVSLANNDAKALLFEALCLKQVIESSFRDREIQKICEYLKNLAASLHTFYNAYKILNSKEQESYLYILMVVSESLTLGLSLLGIQAKTKM